MDLSRISPVGAEGTIKASGRRGLTIQEGLALLRAMPSFVERTSFFLIGSQLYRPELASREVHRMIPALNVDDLDKVELTTRPAHTSSLNWAIPSVLREY